MFLMVETRPNIAFATSIISCFAKNLSHQYIKAIKTILQYLKGSKKQKITYGSQNKLLIEKYSDSDWAEDKKSWNSNSGSIFMLNNDQISQYSKKQPIIAFLSSKAKYIALIMVVKKAIWQRFLFKELGFLQLD